MWRGLFTRASLRDWAALLNNAFGALFVVATRQITDRATRSADTLGDIVGHLAFGYHLERVLTSLFTSVSPSCPE